MSTVRWRPAALAALVVLSMAVAACSSASPVSGESASETTGSSSTGAGADSSSGTGSDSPSGTVFPSDADSEPGDDGENDVESTSQEDGAPGQSAAPDFTAVAPAPRLPVDCTQLFTALAGFAAQQVTPTVVGGAQEAVLAQAGFIDCQAYGQLSGTPVTIRAVVGVDIPRSVAQTLVDAAVAEGHRTDLGAELAHSNCGSIGQSAQCHSGVYANGYFAEVSFRQMGLATATFDDAALQFTSSLATRVGTWGSPPPAWEAPRDALRWASDCETDVASSDDAVVAAMRYPVSSPVRLVTDVERFELSTIASERVGFTFCEWRGAANVFVLIVPGASWKFAQPGALTGTPYSFADAIATLAVSRSEGSVQLVIDDSLVIVRVGTDYYQQPIPAEQLAAIPVDVADVIVSEFGGR